MIDINDIDYAKLAKIIIKEFDEDKEENGTKSRASFRQI